MASIASVAAKAVAKTVGRSVLRLWDEFEKRLAALEAWMAKGGGGSDMPLMVITDEWEGTSGTTRTFASEVMGLSIVNEGTSNLTFTIGSMTLTVGPDETFDNTFNPFTSITITASGLYRALVTAPYGGTITPPVTPPGDTTAPNVTISPAGGTYTSSQSVTLSANETATIYYTLDGSNPTAASLVYSGPITLNSNATLKYFGKDTAGNSSPVQTATYTINAGTADTTPPTVTISPAAGSFTSAQTITLSANEAATIYYTTDGSTPTTASLSYSAPFALSSTATVRYFARDTAGNSSTVQSAAYTINIAQSDTTPPVLTMTAAATFSNTQTVTMSANETATIYYTVDGSDPKTSGTKVQYSSPVTLSATTTVKAYAVDSANNESVVQTVTYTKQAAATGEAYALNFSGTNSQVTSTTNMGITANQARTVEFRFRTSDVAVNQSIVEWGTNSASQINSYCIFNSKIMLLDGTNYNDSYATAITPLAVNTWYHVVFTFDGTNENWYINGSNTRNGAYDSAMNTSASPIKLGYGARGSFKGDLDYVRVYNKVLTAAEVTNNKNGTVTRTGLINEWLISEGTGTTITDTAGTNNLTASNTTWVSNA